MVYKSLFGFVIAFLFLATINDVAIAWRDDIKLTWKQFKGQPNTNIDAVALTASGITFEFSVRETNIKIVSFSTKVFAHFYPDKSWYIVEKGNDHILEHEQLHFDITELYARKFRKQIAQLKVSNNIKNQLRTLHQNINKELAVTQNRYDTETDNSVNKVQQDHWKLYVQQELNQLEAYKSQD